MYLLMGLMNMSSSAESLFGAMHSYDVPKFQEAMTCFALAAGEEEEEEEEEAEEEEEEEEKDSERQSHNTPVCSV